jgi:hypothetical protein
MKLSGSEKHVASLISNEKNYELIDYLYDMRIIHVIKQGVSSQIAIGKQYTLYSLVYGCYLKLMSSMSAPLGLIIESDEDNKAHYVEIPKAGYKSVKNSILNLASDDRQGRFKLVGSTEDLQLPTKQKTTKCLLKSLLTKKF